MKRTLVSGGVFFALLAALSLSVARAADIPDWWIGPKDEYEKLAAGAKQEGQLVLWSHPDPMCTPLIAGPFEEKYGVKVEHVEYTTAQIVQRILLEGVAGIYSVDVGNLSVHHVPRLEQKNLLQKLNYRENVTTYKKVPKMVSPHSTAYISWTSPRGLAWNTNKVPKNKVPNSYEDVLDPMFKDRKISVDTDLKEYIILAHQWGMEKTEQYVKRLGDMKPKFHPNNTVITQMVAAGEALIAPGVIRRIPLMEFKNKGAPIDWKPLKPLVPVDTLLMGVMKNAPHPNAAALWAYWSMGSLDFLKGMDKCGGYANVMVPGAPHSDLLKGFEYEAFDWEWGVRAAKEGFGEKFRKVIGVE
ncbi:MAG TPA: ABC transporter substrate-binding protein [Candidatus Binatia bacterium]|nr:ABC transporter substrate-binding protein [Candidatus Binatia bacterium]